MTSFDEKFRVGQLRVASVEGWNISVRPAQVTLGSLVVSSAMETASFRDLSLENAAALGRVFSAVEAALDRCFAPVLNHFMGIMLVDRRLHFHVFPRYQQPVDFAGEVWTDQCYPGPLASLEGVPLQPAQETQLVNSLSSTFSSIL